jgi:hypothetical protein
MRHEKSRAGGRGAGYGAPKLSQFFNYVLSLLKIVSSYLLFVMSILISLCHNSEPLVHNSDRYFIIRTRYVNIMALESDIINRLIYR